MKKSLTYSKMLEEVGVPRNQADIHVGILEDMVDEDIATKVDLGILRSDIDKLEASLRADIEKLETSLRADIDRLEFAMKAGFAGLEQKMTIKLGAMLFATLGLQIAIIKLFFV